MTTDNPEVQPEQPPRTKRNYKKRVLKNDAEKALANLIATHRYVKRDILKCIREKECRSGTGARLNYLKALQELEIDFLKQITAMGYIPKNAKAESRTEFIYKAIVGHGGLVSTVPVNGKELTEMSKKKVKGIELPYAPEDEAIREALEREFGSSAVQGETQSHKNH